ncbi:uncharacterized protein LOC143703745 [Siphateles boraxobius]|uniref:uncharacterized protein LOC143703745 n=1 Tax=Siphateles boraxobius TaxID=180520 RepID=UPI00406484D2
MLFLVSLQHMALGDDTIREALYHLRDLMDYAHLFTFDMNAVYMPNVHIESGEMCSCKEFIAQELLKTLVSAEITDQDGAVESRTALKLLQHNIRFLLQNSIGEHCLKDKVMVRKINLRTNQELTFIRRCFTFFQDWMSKCISSSDF